MVRGVKEWCSFGWATVAHSFWKWLVIMPLALLGAVQVIREEFLTPSQQDALRLLEFLPDWHWAIWICFALGALVLSVWHGAYLKYSRTVRDYEDRLVQQQVDLHLEYSNNLSSVTSIIAPSTPLNLTVEPIVHRLPLQSDGDLVITNNNNLPIICTATGYLLSGSPRLVNGGRNYAIKWQGTTAPEIQIPTRSLATLNVVSFAMPKLFSLLGMSFGVYWGLVFPTAGTHALRGYFWENPQSDRHYKSGKAVETSISLRVRIDAWPLAHPGHVTKIEKVYIAKSGKIRKELTFEETHDPNDPTPKDTPTS